MCVYEYNYHYIYIYLYTYMYLQMYIYIYIYMHTYAGVCTEFRQKSANDNGLVELTDMFADDTNILVWNYAVVSSFFCG